MIQVGVIGAGVMGRGVTQSLIESGMKTILVDISDSALKTATKEIHRNMRFSSLLTGSKETDNIDRLMGNVSFTTNMDLLKDSDFIIENITEDFEEKKIVYEQLNDICSENAVVLIDTSCISITKLAATYQFPEKVIGAHFMNPVPLMTAVEVIRGFYTSDQTIEETKIFLQKLGKESILVNDYPGFVSNRISHLYINEAAFIMQDGIATAFIVDEIFKKCYGHKMGPLETADLIGLDTVVKSLKILYESYQDTKFRCCPLLDKMVDAGLCGRKTGRGFYEY